MSSETSKKTKLTLLEGGELSLGDLAQQTAAEIQEDREQEERDQERERVLGLLRRIGEINYQIAKAIHTVRTANPADKKALIARLEDPRTKLENEKTELLNDPGVQIKHIEKLTEELARCKRWDDLADIVEDAHSRGWFKLYRNERGNINYRSLRVPDSNNAELHQTIVELKKTVIMVLERVILERDKDVKKQ